MTADDFRSLALDLHGALERAHMGHPDFRADGRIFASLTADESWGVVKLTPDEQREFVRLHRDVFVPAAGAWGRQGYTKVRLDSAGKPAVRTALLLAWQHAVEAPRRKPSPAPSSRPRRATSSRRSKAPR